MNLFFISYLILSSFIFADPEIKAAVDQMLSFNKMREALASTLDGKKEPIVLETFKQTCAPASQAFKEWGAQKGYLVKTLSDRYRNPNHSPNEEEQKVIDLFRKDSQKIFHEVNSPKNNQNKITQLYVRIPVAASCLHCHGEKEGRPDFIKEKYKSDRAFGFKVGDLRGLYSVTIDRSKK